MNADTLAVARASSPAMSTSSGRSWARALPKTMLNAAPGTRYESYAGYAGALRASGNALPGLRCHFLVV
jgi:hypothetical protein